MSVKEGGDTNRGKGGLEVHACPQSGAEQEYLLPVVASRQSEVDSALRGVGLTFCYRN